ncbi:inositol monophosphatase family protein [Brachybacterium endophyticum]|uniref:inositol monophosphatase family protein n=1 Tax=Brachybacterium endophyticum TaxID=2182385 RepID=UPI001F0C0DF1|nr:inositol monophosphatase family protein [Brachybacterium endophyticum]
MTAAEQILEAAEAAAGLAADYVRGLDRSALQREYKNDSHDIVTAHDRACEEIIVRELARRVPGARIVGEEGGERRPVGENTGAHDEIARIDGEVTFYVDPIDGTSNFAAGLPLFCVSIGAAIDGELVAGVIDAPILGEVFSAADGPLRINGAEVEPRRTLDARDALVLTSYPGYRAHRELPEVAAGHARRLADGVSAVRNLGSAAIELAYVAAGRADATMLPSINAWDVAAGFHLVQRAGGSLRTWPGTSGQDRPVQEQPAYVACTGPERLGVLDQLMDEVQAAREG